MICVDLWRVVKREKRGPSPKIPRIRVAQMAYWFTLFYGCIGHAIGHARGHANNCHVADSDLNSKGTT